MSGQSNNSNVMRFADVNKKNNLAKINNIISERYSLKRSHSKPNMMLSGAGGSTGN